MKTIAIFVTALLLGVSTAFAQPATAPSSVPPPLVLFVPLKQLSDTGGHDWVAAAIEENLVSEASRAGDITKTLDPSQSTSNTAAAVRAGHDAGANIVVFGSYQIVEDQLRVNAQAVDVSSGQMIAPITATGNMRDLFKIEDVLADQLRPALPRTGAATMPQMVYGNSNTNPYDAIANPNQQPQTQGIYPYNNMTPDNTQAYPDGYPVNTYPYTASPYYYPAYSDYGYPYYYGYPSYYPYYGGYYGPAFYGGIYIGRGFGGFGGGARGGFVGGFHSGGGFHGGGHGR
jgi:TolB-like protein